MKDLMQRVREEVSVNLLTGLKTGLVKNNNFSEIHKDRLYEVIDTRIEVLEQIPENKRLVSQYCNVCDETRDFYYLGRQEIGKVLELYNCKNCGGTQTDRS